MSDNLEETAQKILEMIPDETKPYCIFIEDSNDPYNCPMLKLENVYWYRKLKRNEKFIPRCGFTGKELMTDSKGSIFKCDGCARGYKG